MTKFDGNGMYVQCEHVVSCEVEGGTALLDLQASEYYQLNATASLVWEALSAPHTVDDVVEAVMERFDVDSDRCHSDVVAILGQFHAAKMIERPRASAA